MEEIKIEIPKFSIEQPSYDFDFIAANLGLVPLPGQVAIQPAAIVMIEDGVIAADEDGLMPVDAEPVTLIHFSNQTATELNAEQMAALESFIRDARAMQAEIMARQTASAQRGSMNDLARRAGLNFKK
jgi:hypothetical protein